jgi:hypothetical protein
VRAAAFTLLLLVSTLAAGQDRTVLYDNPTSLVTASRLTALGGAAVGLAENSESIPWNYASVAHRHPRRKGFDWDLTAGVLFSPFPTLRDRDNDGSQGNIVSPVDSQFGGLLQFKRVGLGGYARFSRQSLCNGNDCFVATAALGAFAVGFNALRDQLVFGIGASIAYASFELGGKTYEYRGFSLGGSALWRPLFLPFRIGVHGVTQTLGTPTFDPTTAPILPSGRAAWSNVVSPAHLSIGASARFGQGSWRYNRLSPSALKELPDEYNFAEVPHDLDPDDPRPPGRFMVTVQLDVILPVKNATTLSPFLLGTPTLGAGQGLYLVPRLGFEAEAIDHRLRLRIGGYLEPPFVEGSSIRPHGTFGSELFLFNIFADWSVSAAIDVAAHYMSLSFGLGWWS